MSTTTAARQGLPAAAPPVPIPVPRRASRRVRPGLTALAVAFVAVGGLATAYAVTLVGDIHAYLAVARPVHVGAALTASDMTTVSITADPALRPIPASRVNQVVGKYTAVELIPGTLLTEKQLTDTPIPGAGKNIVGLGLPVDRLPASRIKPGVEVLLVATPAQAGVTATGNTATTGPPQKFPATVIDVAKGTREGTVLVNVAVDARDAPTVAALAATDRLVIVLAGG